MSLCSQSTKINSKTRLSEDSRAEIINNAHESIFYVCQISRRAAYVACQEGILAIINIKWRKFVAGLRQFKNSSPHSHSSALGLSL